MSETIFAEGNLQDDIVDFLKTQPKRSAFQADIIKAMSAKRKYGKGKSKKSDEQAARTTVGLALKKLASKGVLEFSTNKAIAGRTRRNSYKLVA